MENHQTKPGFVYSGFPIGESVFLNDALLTQGVITAFRPPIALPCKVYNPLTGIMEVLFLTEVYEIDKAIEVHPSSVSFI